jgi:hypothetical protein
VRERESERASERERENLKGRLCNHPLDFREFAKHAERCSAEIESVFVLLN